MRWDQAHVLYERPSSLFASERRGESCRLVGLRLVGVAEVPRAGGRASDDASPVSQITSPRCAVAEGRAGALVTCGEVGALKDWHRAGEVAELVADAPASLRGADARTVRSSKAGGKRAQLPLAPWGERGGPRRIIRAAAPAVLVGRSDLCKGRASSPKRERITPRCHFEFW